VVPDSLGQCWGEPQNSQDTAELEGGKLLVAEVYSSKGSCRKNILSAFERFVIFWGFTEVRGCFPTAETFLLFRLTAAVILSEVFPPG